MTVPFCFHGGVCFHLTFILRRNVIDPRKYRQLGTKFANYRFRCTTADLYVLVPPNRSIIFERSCSLVYIYKIIPLFVPVCNVFPTIIHSAWKAASLAESKSTILVDSDRNKYVDVNCQLRDEHRCLYGLAYLNISSCSRSLAHTCPGIVHALRQSSFRTSGTRALMQVV